MVDKLKMMSMIPQALSMGVITPDDVDTFEAMLGFILSSREEIDHQDAFSMAVRMCDITNSIRNCSGVNKPKYQIYLGFNRSPITAGKVFVSRSFDFTDVTGDTINSCVLVFDLRKDTNYTPRPAAAGFSPHFRSWHAFIKGMHPTNSFIQGHDEVVCEIMREENYKADKAYYMQDRRGIYTLTTSLILQAVAGFDHEHVSFELTDNSKDWSK
jgi:hypothetical protein